MTAARVAQRRVSKLPTEKKYAVPHLVLYLFIQICVVIDYLGKSHFGPSLKHTKLN